MLQTKICDMYVHACYGITKRFRRKKTKVNPTFKLSSAPNLQFEICLRVITEVIDDINLH